MEPIYLQVLVNHNADWGDGLETIKDALLRLYPDALTTDESTKKRQKTTEEGTRAVNDMIEHDLEVQAAVEGRPPSTAAVLLQEKVWFKSQGHEYPEVRAPILNYKIANAGIRLSISEGAGESGLCGGVITSNFLDKNEIDTDHFIIVAYSKVQLRRRPYWKFSGFTTCNFSHKWPKEVGLPTLYINVLCANVPGVAQKIMTEVICNIGQYLAGGRRFVLGSHGGGRPHQRAGAVVVADDRRFRPTPSPPAVGLISAIQLSSLTYVIGYYYKKWYFRFYSANGKYDVKVNAQASTLPRIGSQIELFEEWKNLVEEEEEEEPGGAAAAAADLGVPGIKVRLEALNKCVQEEIDKRQAAKAAAAAAVSAATTEMAEAAAAKATAVASTARALRYECRTRRKYLNVEMDKAANALKETQEFMDPNYPPSAPADPSPYSVAVPNYNIIKLRKESNIAVGLQIKDPGGEGWTMLIPADKVSAAAETGGFAPSIATVCAAMGGGGCKKRRKSKRRKKGTKKRALKKRHRRRTKRPKRRRRTRRRRRRRRRRTRR